MVPFRPGAPIIARPLSPVRSQVTTSIIPEDKSLTAFRSWQQRHAVPLYNLGIPSLAPVLTPPPFFGGQRKLKRVIQNNGTLHDLYRLYQQRKYTNLRLDVGNKIIEVHRLVLMAASAYFEGRLSGLYNDDMTTITINTADADIFRLYIDFIYGQPLEINDWRTAFKLFDYIKFTLTAWPNKDNDVVKGVSVPSNDYVEYIQRLAELYDGEVPNDVIQATASQLYKPVDLSPLNEEVIILLFNSPGLKNDQKARQELLDYLRFVGADQQLITRLSNQNFTLNRR